MSSEIPLALLWESSHILVYFLIYCTMAGRIRSVIQGAKCCITIGFRHLNKRYWIIYDV